MKTAPRGREDATMTAQQISAYEVETVPTIHRHDADRLDTPAGTVTISPPEADPLYDELPVAGSHRAWVAWTLLAGAAVAAGVAALLAALS